MSRNQHKIIVEHIWRILRALLILAATVIWLYTVDLEWLVLSFGILAALVDQFKGFIENRLDDLLHWKRDFNNWD